MSGNLKLASQFMKIDFSKLSFLDFRPWLRDFVIFDVNIGFYVNNCVFWQLDMSGDGKCGQTIGEMHVQQKIIVKPAHAVIIVINTILIS